MPSSSASAYRVQTVMGGLTDASVETSKNGGWYPGADTLKFDGIAPAALEDAVTSVDPALCTLA